VLAVHEVALALLPAYVNRCLLQLYFLLHFFSEKALQLAISFEIIKMRFHYFDFVLAPLQLDELLLRYPSFLGLLSEVRVQLKLLVLHSLGYFGTDPVGVVDPDVECVARF